MEEFKEELNVVEKYLVHRDYHNEFSKAEKTNLRRKCRNNYKMEDGVSHYRKRKEAMWHTCIRRDEEKKRVMELCHNGLAGLRNFFFFARIGYFIYWGVFITSIFNRMSPRSRQDTRKDLYTLLLAQYA